jgi:hypothetical protein
MKKQIDLMTQVIQRNNLGDFIPEGAKKKKEEDHAAKKGNHHALVVINSSWCIPSYGSERGSFIFLKSMLKTPYSHGG